MAIKRKPSTKAKQSPFTGRIRALETCLAADQAKLKTAFPKVLMDVGKAIARTEMELKAMKKVTTKAKSAKGGKSLKAGNSLVVSRKLKAKNAKLTALKNEKMSILKKQQKFVALLKARQQFEKVWVRNASRLTKKTPSRSHRAKSARVRVLRRAVAIRRHA